MYDKCIEVKGARCYGELDGDCEVETMERPI